ncbi:MAG: D-2-hydroxyacid dehydrogenase [Planctomycetaceae bacterium]|nr:D-2-hydroxyacid dehydrogenase [Planctomycetales bacterium]MCB9925811.1 D-2-hydroxyacid dehydrogenase [Planctomycetaceae bacterium]
MRVVLCYPVEQRHRNQIAAVSPNIELVDAGQERIAKLLGTADIFCGHAKVPVPWDAVVAAGRLRWIQSSAAGMDHCLVPPVIASDILVTSASGLFADQVAEQTMALLLGLLRGLPTFFRQQQSKDFTRRPTGDLHGKTIAIIGLGGNGRRIAEVLSPFRVRILATDMFPHNKPPHVESVGPADELHRVLSQVDIAILCVPLNSQTYHMIDAAALAKMKPGAMLINVARGPVVDEAALVDALGRGHLSAAGLDVTEVEPLEPTSRLWEMSNVIITPHVGAQSAKRVDDSTDLFCENLERYLRGDRLKNIVDKELGFPRPSFD